MLGQVFEFHDAGVPDIDIMILSAYRGQVAGWKCREPVFHRWKYEECRRIGKESWKTMPRGNTQNMQRGPREHMLVKEAAAELKAEPHPSALKALEEEPEPKVIEDLNKVFKPEMKEKAGKEATKAAKAEH
ncbi:hypothetical protein MMC13_004339 [Lambiella insularis]|nr:hypothetical protein [Lambiella insularis]